MFNFRSNKREVEDFNKNNFLKFINLIQETEREIHLFSSHNHTENVLEIAKKRAEISTQMTSELKSIEEYYTSIENLEHFKEIKEFIKKIETILRIQLRELEKNNILEDSILRTSSINGDLRDEDGNDTDSHLTTKLKELNNLLKSQSGVVIKLITNLKEKEDKLRSEKKRFIVEENTIKDEETGLIWDKNFTDKKQTSWDEAMEYAKQKGKFLPTLEDFKSLSMLRGYDFPSIRYLREIGFIIDEHRYIFWTSEELEENTAYAKVVNLDHKIGTHSGKSDRGSFTCIYRN